MDMRDRESAAAVVPRGVSTSHPMLAISGRDAWLQGSNGKEYLDFASGIGVTVLGHSHPAVVAAIQKQSLALTHSCQHVLMPERYVDLARALAECVPLRPPVKTFLCNSGAEAVENAIKIAKASTGRRAVISVENAFHGRTAMALALTGKVRPYSIGFGAPTFGVFHTPAPYCFRCPRRSEPCCTLSADGGLRRLFTTAVAPEEVAAVIVEPIQGEGGFVVPPPGWLADMARLCREHGIVFIVDEIQCGMGRTGDMWAFEQEDLTPDLVCVGKGIANGLPLAAVVGHGPIMDAPEPGGLGGTYGGNPIAAAAALAVLSTMRTEQLPERAARLGPLVADRLRAMARRIPQVGDVRGRGLMQAVELVDPADGRTPLPAMARAVVEAARERGLILLTAGLYGNVVRLLPPLTIADSELRDGLDRLEAAFAAVCLASAAPAEGVARR
jgi:4-aminobutyrate aminotransferase / (S)-3-amino-2-methylpropionate transaminase / 5-aminovalerate transaminase